MAVHRLDWDDARKQLFSFSKGVHVLRSGAEMGNITAAPLYESFLKGQTFSNTMDHFQAIITVSCTNAFTVQCSQQSFGGVSLFWCCTATQRTYNETMTMMLKFFLRVFTS